MLATATALPVIMVCVDEAVGAADAGSTAGVLVARGSVLVAVGVEPVSPGDELALVPVEVAVSIAVSVDVAALSPCGSLNPAVDEAMVSLTSSTT